MAFTCRGTSDQQTSERQSDVCSSDLPRHVKAIHKATVGQCANTNIISINWEENVSQAWAKINKYKPKGVLLHDKEKEFVGYLSSKDLWEGLNQISELEENDE